MLDSGILINDPEDSSLYILTQDVNFSSPSLAAGVITARSSNGWTSWKNKAGKTLDDVYRQKNDKH